MIADTVHVTVSTDVAQDYETLRTAACGEGLAFEARTGLALFLRRGMWAWARATSDPSDGLRPTQPPCSGPVADDNDKAVVQLFAAMAMSFADRRSHERSSQSHDASSRA